VANDLEGPVWRSPLFIRRLSARAWVITEFARVHYARRVSTCVCLRRRAIAVVNPRRWQSQFVGCDGCDCCQMLPLLLLLHRLRTSDISSIKNWYRRAGRRITPVCSAAVSIVRFRVRYIYSRASCELQLIVQVQDVTLQFRSFLYLGLSVFCTWRCAPMRSL